ncbi:MAG: leucyl aminopeptidase family protein, partial [Pseudomonadota bacterium]|nr:leucyl aminopeptidase family protein [Pseudomonadota bacterium]
WLKSQNDEIKKWLDTVCFPANPGEFCMVPNNRNELQMVVQGIFDDQDILQAGLLARGLPPGDYAFANLDDNSMTLAATAWGLGAYQFSKYKTMRNLRAKLCVDKCVDVKALESVVCAIYLIRDMVNTGTQDMNTHELADKVEEVAHAHGATFSKIVGKDLLKANYPMIYAVGKGSVSEPQLLELRWGDPEHPKVTLVGKGVCFDTGGLNLKFSDGMRYMKKDMAGAAHVLGLAQMIMQQGLPINLRVLIPAVENAISGNAYHPGDVLQSRKGLTVEVTNTDAEGRLVLGDALTEAASESPELIIDIATLTGAARAALGTELSAMFTDDETLAMKILEHSFNVVDPIWRLPLYKPYRTLLQSPVADLTNAVLIPNTGGAITAALFLQEFVGSQTSWVHFDIMGWNLLARHVGIEGAEANVVRALFAYLKERFT